MPDFASSLAGTPALHATHAAQGTPQGRAFVDATVRIGTDGFPEAHRARGLREALAARWLAGNGDDYADTPVRFDEVAMMVVKENRALLRHHINCFGEMEPLS